MIDKQIYNLFYEPVLYSKKYNYIMIYCAKSGCSFVRDFFLEIHKEEISKEIKEEINYHNINKYFLIPNNLKIKEINKVIVVRNPYKRIVSLFINRYLNKKSMLKKVFNNNNIEIPKIESFKNFLLLLCKIKESKKLNHIDMHIREQTYKLKNYQKNLSIIKLENINQLTNFYEKIIKNQNLLNKVENTLLEKKPINKTVYFKSKEKFTDYDFSDYKKDEFPYYKSFYNKQALDLVYYIYKNDFDVLNYKKENSKFL